MELESVSLRLPRDLLSGAQRVATARDVTVGHLVRQLLKREVDRQLAGGTQGPTDARLVTALLALLTRDVTDASSWENLEDRLRPHGYTLRPADEDVVLYKTSCSTRVCNLSELGFGYDTLMARFGKPMPDHSHISAHRGTMPAGRIDPIRHAMLSGHIDAACNWPDLINRLAVEGMEMRPMGAGLGIYIAATGRHLCNSATVGARYKTLVKRYGAAMPGHPHDMSKHLKEPQPDTGIELIERD